MKFLDLFLKTDQNARVACETMATTNRVIIAGETKINDPKKIIDNQVIENVISYLKSFSVMFNNSIVSN